MDMILWGKLRCVVRTTPDPLSCSARAFLDGRIESPECPISTQTCRDSFRPIADIVRLGQLEAMADDDFTAFIPELPDWNNGAGIDAESWIGCVGNYELATGYSLIFWPRFVEFEQYVLREGQFSEDNLREWERATKHDRRAIEAVINHVHLLDIHGDNAPEPTEAQLRYLGRVLRETLEAKLKRDFPHRAFEVVFNDEPDLDLLDYEVTFWQVD
jgi:hypothetical protein